jgi:glycosyltransferase 2 family protein
MSDSQPGTEPGVTVDEATPQHGLRLSWRRLALYGLAGVFLAIVVWRSEIWNADETLSEVDPLLAAAVPLLALGMAPPLALRGREILSVLGYRFSAIALTPIQFYGNMAGFLTPAATGEILRPSMFQRAFNLPLAHGGAVVVFERLFSMYIMCLTGVAAFAVTGILPTPAAIAALAICAVLPAAPYFVMAVLGFRFSAIRARLPISWQARLGGMEEATEALDILWQSARLVLTFTLLSLAVFAVMMLQFWLLVEATGEHISLAEAWVALFASSLIGVLSGLPFGLGAADATLVSILSAYDVDVTTAGTIAVMMRLLMNLPAGILALMAYVVTLRQRAPMTAADSPVKQELAPAGSKRP